MEAGNRAPLFDAILLNNSNIDGTTRWTRARVVAPDQLYAGVLWITQLDQRRESAFEIRRFGLSTTSSFKIKGTRAGDLPLVVLQSALRPEA